MNKLIKPQQYKLYADVIELAAYDGKPACYYHDLLKYELGRCKDTSVAVDRVVAQIKQRHGYEDLAMPKMIVAEVAAFKRRLSGQLSLPPV